MKFNKKKLLTRKSYFQKLLIIFFLIATNPIKVVAQENYQLKEFEVNSTTKSGPEGNLDIPSNPFQLVEMIRRANSMNDATIPSDAIDEALKSFDMINNK
mgnify:CR=1 FL=1